jgi:GT2 family glycosyltransferase
VTPDISLIVVTWNGRQYLEECLGAIDAQRDVRTETILVDNASTDGTVDFVRVRFPSVRIVELPENRGFAAGNNAGAREARAPLLAFLNNDTIADGGWLRALLNGLDPSRRLRPGDLANRVHARSGRHRQCRGWGLPVGRRVQTPPR